MIYQLIQNLVADTLAVSLWAFRAELVLCGTIVAILLVKTIDTGRKVHALYLALAGSLLALYLAAPWHYLGAAGAELQATPIFTGMLVYDKFAIYMRALILLFVVLFAIFTRISGIPSRDDATEFFVLVLGAVVGMCLMISANHMLVVFLGIEMASVPSYALSGILKHRRKSAEAALKFAIFGAGTAGVMLYGISLLVGTLGSAHLPTMALKLAELLQSGAAGPYLVVLVLGTLMVMVGIAFKLSAVPFHFWAPDVFEGAAAEVGAFLSVASKAAALALLVRLTLAFSFVTAPAATTPQTAIVGPPVTATMIGAAEPAGNGGIVEEATAVGRTSVRPSAGVSAGRTEVRPTTNALTDAFKPVRRYLAGLIVLLSAITCTFGNLAAYGQTNMKRLLAYSTIAHAGYMMMPIAAAVAVAGTDAGRAQDAVAAMAFYATIYLFMNLGAFAGTAFLRNALGSEEIADYAGLIRRSPGVAVCMAILLFSLVGVPPLAGFSGKFAIFASVFNAYTLTSNPALLALVVIGVLNTVLSLFYYLRVVKVMCFTTEGGPRGADIPMASPAGMYCLAMAAPMVILFVWWGPLQWAGVATRTLL